MGQEEKKICILMMMMIIIINFIVLRCRNILNVKLQFL